MLTIDSIEALSTRVDALKGYLNIEQKRIEVMDDEKQTQDPDFWNDSKNAEQVMKQIRSKSCRRLENHWKHLESYSTIEAIGLIITPPHR